MSYDRNNVFARILRGEIPTTKVYEDDQCLAFRDVAPQAPKHILVIPKKAIARLDDCKPRDRALLGDMLLAAAEVARKEGLADDGYRIVINSGARANQSVFHLHLHVLGGRDFTWPPG